MIQDIAPHRLDNHFDPERRPEPEDRIISWNDGRMLIAGGEELRRFPCSCCFCSTAPAIF